MLQGAITSGWQDKNCDNNFLQISNVHIIRLYIARMSRAVYSAEQHQTGSSCGPDLERSMLPTWMIERKFGAVIEISRGETILARSQISNE